MGGGANFVPPTSSRVSWCVHISSTCPRTSAAGRDGQQRDPLSRSTPLPTPLTLPAEAQAGSRLVRRRRTRGADRRTQAQARGRPVLMHAPWAENSAVPVRRRPFSASRFLTRLFTGLQWTSCPHAPQTAGLQTWIHPGCSCGVWGGAEEEVEADASGHITICAATTPGGRLPCTAQHTGPLPSPTLAGTQRRSMRAVPLPEHPPTGTPPYLARKSFHTWRRWP